LIIKIILNRVVKMGHPTHLARLTTDWLFSGSIKLNSLISKQKKTKESDPTHYGLTG